MLRFEEFRLNRFGMFEDHPPLAFERGPDQAPDLHIIVGSNEAGKSTFKAALGEFLFRFHNQTPFGFRHNLSDLTLGAVVEIDGTTNFFSREKKREPSLRDETGSLVADSFLSDAMMALSRDDYERLFSLGHQQLIDGGKLLGTGKSDLSQLLFESASGLGHFQARQQDLDSEVQSIWQRDGRSKNQVRELDKRLKAIEKDIRANRISGNAYKNYLKAKKRTEEEFSIAREHVSRLEAEHRELIAHRGAAQHVSDYKEALATIDELKQLHGDITLLPDDAASLLSASRRTIGELEGRLNTLREQRSEEVEKLESIVVDENILLEEDRIEQLIVLAGAVANHGTDIEKQTIRIEERRDSALALASDIGWSIEGSDELHERLPSVSELNLAKSRAVQHETLEIKASSARKNLKAAQRDIELTSKQLEALSASPENFEMLNAIVKAAAKLGDVMDQLGTAEQRLSRLESKINRRLDNLKPWDGTFQELVQASLPRAVDVSRLTTEINEVRSKLETAQTGLSEASIVAEKTREKVRLRRRDTQAIEQQEILDVRKVRDDVWRGIKIGEVAIADADAEFEGYVQQADLMADQRFSSATAIAQISALEEEEATAKIDCENAKQDAESCENKLVELMASWDKMMGDLGAPGLGVDDYAEWVRLREEALEDISNADIERADMARRHNDISELNMELSLAMTNAGSPQSDEISFENLRTTAESFVAEVEADASTNRTLIDQIQTLEARLPSLVEGAEEAEGMLADWRRVWVSSCDACNLDADAPLDASLSTLEEIEEIVDLLKNANTIQVDRVDTMKRDLDNFHETAVSLGAKTLELDLTDPTEIVSFLREALPSAQSMRDERERVRRTIEDHDNNIADLEETLAGAFGSLSSYTERIGVGPRELDKLEAAIDHSNSLRTAFEKRDRAEGQIKTLLSESDIESATQALETSDAATREARLREIDGEKNLLKMMRKLRSRH